ncbi:MULTISPECIES: hypothetical protein [Streptomyces]|uniref:Uncharacterized protein n=1 Tax=Streptomyces odorifer TaxID=53450 RepID=A0A7Y6F4L7_9ACTN|nr:MULTISPECIES: hypothetical protein [Streptomyces]NUV36602.1 hypothetical protein [Streptomyces sp. KAI-27]NUV50602.1 hypothetical protein [Streptomyces sp. CAI-78]MBV1957680.1 hypothetical protein [Streptomyces sp. BV333]MCQ9706364.1 hypothetical protein [Streptomyces sp. BSP1]MDH6190437.1 hypothetical protein [Streptomyces sp. CZ24]
MADERAADRQVRIKDALARVCTELEDLRSLLGETGGDAVLDQLLTAVRSGGDVERELDELHHTLLRHGDAMGAYGDGSRTAVPRPDVLPSAEPLDVVFLCPDGRCSRLWWPDDAREEPPACSLSGEALRWVRT